MSETNILDVLIEILETDRAFFAMSRFINSNVREREFQNRTNQNRQMLTIIRNHMNASRPPRQPSTIVVNMTAPRQNGTTGNFWDPVTTRPTPEQINAGVERNVTTVNESCTICLEAVTTGTRIRRCRHIFHDNCINDWFSMNTRCPVCRADIREHTHTTAENNTFSELQNAISRRSW